MYVPISNEYAALTCSNCVLPSISRGGRVRYFHCLIFFNLRNLYPNEVNCLHVIGSKTDTNTYFSWCLVLATNQKPVSEKMNATPQATSQVPKENRILKEKKIFFP